MKFSAILLLSLAVFSLLSITPAFAYSHCTTNVEISYVTPSIPRQGETVTVYGTVNYGARVDIYFDGEFVASIWPDSTGSWSYSYYASMYQGTHRFDVYAQYDACASDSAAISFTVTGTTTYSPYYPPYYPPSFSGCVGSISVETPDDVYTGDTVASTITLTNSGNSGGTVNFNAYLCRDRSGCVLMECKSDYVPYDYYGYYDPYYSGGYYSGYYDYGYYSGSYYYGDPSVYLPAHSSASFVCSQTARSSGTDRIRVDARGCGLSRSIFSSTFSVKSLPRCTSGYQNEYKCFGNERQQEYQFIDCSSEWRTVETCSYGCTNGECNPQTSVSTVTTTVTSQGWTWPTAYFVWSDVDSTLLLIAFLVAVLILILIAVSYQRQRDYRNAEWFS